LKKIGNRIGGAPVYFQKVKRSNENLLKP